MLVHELCMMSGVLQVLREVLREHEWDFENALGSLLMFSSESGEVKIFLDYVGYECYDAKKNSKCESKQHGSVLMQYFFDSAKIRIA